MTKFEARNLFQRGLVLILILATAFKCDGGNADPGDRNPKKINDRTYGPITKVKQECMLNMMVRYGLTADATSLSEKNRICPKLDQNCCGKGDQDEIEKRWRKDQKKQEAHHRTVMYIYKYILGFSKQYKKIATKIMTDYEERKQKNQLAQSLDKKDASSKFSIAPTRFCYRHAKVVTSSWYTTQDGAEALYSSLSKRLEFVENARLGFYCTLCSPKLAKNTRNTWKIFRIFYNRRIYYNMEFCKKVHTHAFHTTYEMWKDFQPYVRSVIKTLSCVKFNENRLNGGASDPLMLLAKDADGKSNSAANAGGAKTGAELKQNWIGVKLTAKAKEMFDNPLGIRGGFKFATCDLINSQGTFFRIFCQRFCESFNIVKPTPTFDGDIKALKQTYDHLVRYEDALQNRKKSVFRNDVLRMKNDLEKNFKYRQDNGFDAFFKATNDEYSFNRYLTDVETFGDGIDPMEIAQGCTLRFEFYSAHILKIFFVAFVALLF